MNTDIQQHNTEYSLKLNNKLSQYITEQYFINQEYKTTKTLLENTKQEIRINKQKNKFQEIILSMNSIKEHINIIDINEHINKLTKNR